MPEEPYDIPLQSRPSEHPQTLTSQKMPPPPQAREEKLSPPPPKTLPQEFLPYLPFWEQPAFQKDVPPQKRSGGLVSTSPKEEMFSLSSKPPSLFPQASPSQDLQRQLQDALKSLSSFTPPQQPPLPPSQPQPSTTPPQKLQYAQGSFPQPKKLHPLPSSKYIHPSPFDEIYQQYSLPSPVVIGKEGKFLYRIDPFQESLQKRAKKSDFLKLTRRGLIDLQFEIENFLEDAERSGDFPEVVEQLREEINKIGVVLAQFQQARGPIQPPRGGPVPLSPPPPPHGDEDFEVNFDDIINLLESLYEDFVRKKEKKDKRKKNKKKIEYIEETLHPFVEFNPDSTRRKRGGMGRTMNDKMEAALDIRLECIEEIKEIDKFFKENKKKAEEIIKKLEWLLLLLESFYGETTVGDLEIETIRLHLEIMKAILDALSKL